MREAATICSRPLQVDLWPFDLESGIRVTCDVGYLCANFGLPGPLCSRLRPDVSDRQAADVRCASSLNAPYATGGGIISNVLYRARIFVKYISHAYFIRRTIAYGRTRLQYGHKVKYRHSSLLWWYLCLSVLYRATSGNLGLWYHTHDTSHSRRLSQIRLSGFVASAIVAVHRRQSRQTAWWMAFVSWRSRAQIFIYFDENKRGWKRGRGLVGLYTIE